MFKRKLGNQGLEVSAMGLGCMGLSGVYGPTDEAEGLAVIREAVDAGITLLDTGDFYEMGHNEMLLREALKGIRRERILIQVKFGAQRDPAGRFIGYDNRPVAVKASLAYSLKRLGTDYIDIYQPARLDPAVPIEDTVGAMAEMVQAGYVRHIGLSEVGAATLRRARAVHPVTALQIEYSLMSRGIEAEILPAARELGIGVTAYGVLSRGLLGGGVTEIKGKKDIRNRYPRYQAEQLKSNLALVEALWTIALEMGATPAQLAFAWVLSRGTDIVPLIGARNRDQLRDALAAPDLKLTVEDLARIEAAVPADKVAGSRYDAAAMAHLDSEHSAGK